MRSFTSMIRGDGGENLAGISEPQVGVKYPYIMFTKSHGYYFRLKLNEQTNIFKSMHQINGLDLNSWNS